MTSNFMMWARKNYLITCLTISGSHNWYQKFQERTCRQNHIATTSALWIPCHFYPERDATLRHARVNLISCGWSCRGHSEGIAYIVEFPIMIYSTQLIWRNSSISSICILHLCKNDLFLYHRYVKRLWK